MTNLEWLKHVRITDEQMVDFINERAIKNGTLRDPELQDFKMRYRQMRATEIIAETLIGIERSLDAITNIDGDAIRIDVCKMG